MTCHKCGTKIVERKATPEAPYRYRISGLKNVFLAGITLRRCIHCGTESPVIPKIVELNRLIAQDLAEKADLLKGDEVRYLRKFAGFSSGQFAILLRMTQANLSRFECGHQANLGAQADKLARAIAMSAVSQKYMRKILIGIADDPIQARKRANKARTHPVFRLNRNKWTRAA